MDGVIIVVRLININLNIVNSGMPPVSIVPRVAISPLPVNSQKEKVLEKVQDKIIMQGIG